MLRTAVAKELGIAESPAVKDGCSAALDKLMAKGRVRMDGKKVVLLKSNKKDGKSDDEGADSSAASGHRKRKAEDSAAADHEAFTAKLKAGLAPPEPGTKRPSKAAAWSEQGPLNAGDTGTRVFLGNLSFKIDEVSLAKAIAGVTHIKWVNDKETHKFYGTGFVELAALRGATACVAMAGSNVLGRPLKANLAPPHQSTAVPRCCSGRRGRCLGR
jgi:nucleolin